MFQKFNLLKLTNLTGVKDLVESGQAEAADRFNIKHREIIYVFINTLSEIEV